MTLEDVAWVALVVALVVIVGIIDRRAGALALLGAALGALASWRITRREEPTGPVDEPTNPDTPPPLERDPLEDITKRIDATDTKADDADAERVPDGADDLDERNALLRERLRRAREDRD